MFARLVGESFTRNPRRKLLTAAALVVGMAVATSTLTISLEVGDRLAHEFRSFGANLLVTPQSDTLPVEIGGVEYRPVDEGAYLDEADLGKLKTIFWRHNIEGFTPFLDVPAFVRELGAPAIVVGTWYEHDVPVPDGTRFKTGLSITHPWWTIDGRWFQDGAQECVVGAALAAKHPAEIKIGKTLELGHDEKSGSGRALVITGIVSTGGSEDRTVLVPLSVAQNLSHRPGQFRSLFVSALTKPADALAERGEMALNDKNIQLTPTEYDRWFCSPYISSISYQIKTVLPGTEVRAIRRVAETEGRVLSRVGTLLWIVTLAALLAAALAVAATSATTVLERRSEIGVMKALGASNTAITGLFLIEQLLLALAGGALGFVVGAVFARILGASVFGAPASPRFILVPIICGLAAIVALAGSLIPLRRAARLRPALILRGP
jgi:putative ABC transport system permease protein